MSPDAGTRHLWGVARPKHRDERLLAIAFQAELPSFVVRVELQTRSRAPPSADVCRRPGELREQSDGIAATDACGDVHSIDDDVEQAREGRECGLGWALRRANYDV